MFGPFSGSMWLLVGYRRGEVVAMAYHHELGSPYVVIKKCESYQLGKHLFAEISKELAFFMKTGFNSLQPGAYFFIKHSNIYMINGLPKDSIPSENLTAISYARKVFDGSIKAIGGDESDAFMSSFKKNLWSKDVVVKRREFILRIEENPSGLINRAETVIVDVDIDGISLDRMFEYESVLEKAIANSEDNVYQTVFSPSVLSNVGISISVRFFTGEVKMNYLVP